MTSPLPGNQSATSVLTELPQVNLFTTDLSTELYRDPQNSFSEQSWSQSSSTSSEFATELNPDLSPNLSSFSFASGMFTVGNTGQVSIDYLFDGGAYQGELAIFSLSGLEQFTLGTPEFIHEIARRALSNSTLGHVVLSDPLEGARFSDTGWNDNFNQDDYLGVKTFTMNPGDRFGLMLLPNGTIQQLLEQPTLGGSQRPLFSLVNANPNAAFQVGQIADVTGNGSTFVFEDQRLDATSDRDYNDLIFQIRGAIGDAALLSEVINPNLDWRNTTVGQALLNYAAAYDNPKVTQTVDYGFPASNQPLIGIIDTGFAANNPDIDYSRLILGSDRIGNDDNPLLAPGEGNEHGTHILGLIGATQNNGIGIDGINDKAPIWVGRAIGSGQWADSLAEFVTAHIASNQPNAVVNLSLDLTQTNPDGTITTRYEFTPAERAAIEFARQHNVVLVVAAGNDGGTMSALGQASQEFDNIITVGSADDLNRADYSSYGYGLNILAPGGTNTNPILSTVSNGVGTMAGTSVATAQVTGAIAQMWAANPGLSYRQIIELLQLTATDLNLPNWDAETGAGLLNAAAAVTLAQATLPQDHEAPASLIPNTWGGEGLVTPLERAAGPFNYPVRSESFSGTVGPRIGVNLRNSPWFGDRGSRNEPFGRRLFFDAWTYGERGTDIWLNRPDELWYRVAGTNLWVPSAYIAGYPGSRPPVLAPSQPNPNQNSNTNPNPNTSTSTTAIQIGGYTISGNFYPVFAGYRATLGNPTSNILLHPNGATYQLFERGSIVSSRQGTFPLYGSIRQTFLNTGGLNGWLGVPKSAETSQGNGVVIQYFENGYIIWNGSRATAYQYGNAGTGGGNSNPPVLPGTGGGNSNRPILIRTGGGGIEAGLRFLDGSVSNLRGQIASLESQVRNADAVRKKNNEIIISRIQQRERRISEIKSNPLWVLWAPNYQAISTLESEIRSFKTQKDINDRTLLRFIGDLRRKIVVIQPELNRQEAELQRYRRVNEAYVGLEQRKNDETWWENEINDWSDAVEINENRDPNLLGKVYQDLSNDLFGKFFPLSAAYISDDYKNATSGAYGFHGGIDIGATRGTSVKSVVSGVVVGSSSGWGKVTIRDAQGLNHIYGHMAGITVQDGQTVAKGQIIGTVSDVGVRGSIHLHYEVAEADFPGGSLANTSQPWSQLTKEHFRDRTRNPLKYYWEMKWNGWNI